MFNNKKSQVIFFGIMMGIMVFIAMVETITPIKDTITTARDADHLDCTNSSNSVGTKATCVVIDFSLFYYVGVMMAAAIGGMAAYRIKKATEG